MHQLIHASKEKPVLLCNTCGIATSFVQKINHFTPQKREKRKTWRRINKKRIDPVKFNKDGEPIEGEQRVTYFSSVFIDSGCLEKKHKLGVRMAPFPRFLVNQLNFKKKGIVMNFQGLKVK
jgi:hypothetical protein